MGPDGVAEGMSCSSRPGAVIAVMLSAPMSTGDWELRAPVEAVHDRQDLRQGAPQVLVRRQAHGCHLHKNRMDASLDHVLKQVSLQLVPQVCQGRQAQS